jgi:glycosyltransferase involved in cell wall biosynthesis
MSSNSFNHLISIIIPVYNREHLFHETLDSILCQTYSNWECIIVDDGSDDMTYQIAQQYTSRDNRFKSFRRPWFRKKGANTCRNYGFELSIGEFIQWFDSDDLMDSKMIEIAINHMLSNSCEMGVVSALYFRDTLFDVHSKSYFSDELIGDNPAFEYFTLKYYFQTSQVIFKRASLISFKKYFNIKLKRNQETEFFISLLLDGIKFSSINDSIVYIRNHDNSITSKHKLLDISDKQIKDFDAYKYIFKSFKRSKYFTDYVINHFSTYFFKSLKKANPNSFIYFRIYLFGNAHGLYPSFILSSKIFIYRLFNN